MRALLLVLTLTALGGPIPTLAAQQPPIRLGSQALRHSAEVSSLRFDIEARVLESGARGEVRWRWSIEDGSRLDDGAAPAPEPAMIQALREDASFQVITATSPGTWLILPLMGALPRLIQAAPADAPASLAAPRALALETGGLQALHGCFSPDASAVVLVGESVRARDDFSTTLVCFDVPGGARRWQLDLPGMRPSGVVVAPGSEGGAPSVVVASSDGRMARRSLASGDDLGTWRAHDSRVLALAAGPGGALITGTSHGELAAWTLGAADEPAQLRWRRKGHLGAVTSLACVPSLGLAASGGRDQRVRLWSWTDGAPRAEPDAHASRLTAALWSRDQARGVTASWAGRLGLWQTTGEWVTWIDAHEGRVTGLALLPRSHAVLSSGQDGRLALWSLDDGRALAPALATSAAVLDMDATTDGSQLATSGGDGRVRLWRIDQDGATPGLQLAGEVESGTRTAWAVAWLPNGRQLAIAGSRVRLMDVASGTPLWDVAVGAPVADLAVSPDGSRIAAALASRAVVVLDAADGSLTWRWSDHPGRVTAVAFSPDGRRLAAGGGDPDVRVVTVPEGPAPQVTGDTLRLRGHLLEATALRWSSDGTLVSSSGDGSALVWRP